MSRHAVRQAPSTGSYVFGQCRSEGCPTTSDAIDLRIGALDSSVHLANDPEARAQMEAESADASRDLLSWTVRPALAPKACPCACYLCQADYLGQADYRG